MSELKALEFGVRCDKNYGGSGISMVNKLLASQVVLGYKRTSLGYDIPMAWTKVFECG